MTAERRAAATEIRAKGRKLEGYAAVFNTETRIMDFVETIAPGAFAASLAEARDVLALVDHDPSRVLARTKSGSLRLAEDSRGLTFDLDLPNTQPANDILALVESRNAGGMSIAFSVRSGGQHWDGERRTLRSVDLIEVSVVAAWPAYPDTSVNARSLRTAGHWRVSLARRHMDCLGGP